jgi:energy-coupling factor transporter ATP-binding protein EcfA2
MKEIEQAFREFNTYIIAHPLLRKVHADLMQVIHHPIGISLITICGPTGAGKTTLIQVLDSKIREEKAGEMMENPGVLPIVRVEAPAPDSGDFDWGDFYYRFLQATEEPLIDYKEIRPASQRTYGRRNTHAELRRAVEACLQHRQTKIVIIDEAQHIAKVKGSGAKVAHNMDALKSLSNLSGVLFVLAGTYETTRLLEQSGQLGRRTTSIELRRYRRTSEDEIAFKNVLHQFQIRIPLPNKPDLMKNWEQLYEGSLGCVGILKDWLKRATASALVQNRDRLTAQDLEGSAIPKRSLLKIAREISEGEKVFQDDLSAEAQIRGLLGIPELRPKQPAEGSPVVHRPNPVGQRKAIRDAVGTEIANAATGL